MDRTGIGIVGAGNIADFHVNAIEYIPEAWVPAVYDLNPQAAKHLAERCGAQATSSLKELLALDEVQVVAVCTPSGAHAEPAVAAAKAGKHLIIEKPLEVTLSRADQIINAAAKSDCQSSRLTGPGCRRQSVIELFEVAS